MPPAADTNASSELPPSAPARRTAAQRLLRAMGWVLGGVAASVFTLLLVVALALAAAYPQLPDIGSLTDYRPKLPLRVYSSDGLLLGEFGEERRSFVAIAQIPQVMKDAVLAAEDARFYSHGGVDYKGVLRATLENFRDARSQGASTITMQVARNFYLSTEKTFTRKIYEILLALRIESVLSKPWAARQRLCGGV
jgi:penicillin-binding protein 1A